MKAGDLDNSHLYKVIEVPGYTGRVVSITHAVGAVVVTLTGENGVPRPAMAPSDIVTIKDNA